MQKTFITWNVTNWATIFLMAVSGGMILSLVVKAFQKKSEAVADA